MKEPRAQKSKEELIAQMKSNVDFQKKMAFVRGKFWPALLEASTSIDDASTLLSGFNTTIMQEFLGMMKQKKMSELQLGVKLDATSDKFLENQKLLELFEEMSVFEAKEMIEGMRNEIAQFQLDEMRERPLSSLKTKWIDEL